MKKEEYYNIEGLRDNFEILKDKIKQMEAIAEKLKNKEKITENEMDIILNPKATLQVEIDGIENFINQLINKREIDS